jgi:ubiquinone/menaquinone biosynthesis C-methylase UbiE
MSRKSAAAQAWEDWGSVNPLYAILTDPVYRSGGDVDTFLDSGAGTVEWLLKEVDQLGLSPTRGAALDFGCGVGRLTWALAGQYSEVVGVDVAASMVARARELHSDLKNCRFEVNQSPDLSLFPDESFDLVLTLFVLQHLPTTEMIAGYLREFVRVLRPDGALVVQLPSKVPAHRPPMPPWNTRDGLRVRTAKALRRAGASPRFLYDNLDWVPEMTMLGLSDEATRSVLDAAGAAVVHSSEPEVDRGGTESRIYYVTRR